MKVKKGGNLYIKKKEKEKKKKRKKRKKKRKKGVWVQANYIN